MIETQRLTDSCWENLDTWEMCGNDKHCTRGCHEAGGCTNGCKVVQLYRRLAMYEDREEKTMKDHDAKVITDFVEGYKKWMKNNGEYCDKIEKCPKWCIDCYVKYLKEKNNG